MSTVCISAQCDSTNNLNGNKMSGDQPTRQNAAAVRQGSLLPFVVREVSANGLGSSAKKRELC